MLGLIGIRPNTLRVYMTFSFLQNFWVSLLPGIAVDLLQCFSSNCLDECRNRLQVVVEFSLDRDTDSRTAAEKKEQSLGGSCGRRAILYSWRVYAVSSWARGHITAELSVHAVRRYDPL